MYGLLAVFEDVSSLLGTLIFNTFYPLTRDFFNGTMFLVAAFALLIPLIILKILPGLDRKALETDEAKKVVDRDHSSSYCESPESDRR